ncbi:MAG: hypothetical protein V4534_04470 [Myxococcota bacterium]
MKSSNSGWTRNDLLTNDMPLSKISGLFRSEEHPPETSMPKFISATKEKYDYEEVFGDYCPVFSYIKCPVDKAFEYAANPFSLEEWTYTLRDLKLVEGDLYVGREALAPDTSIYVRTESYADSKVVDYLCAWDQPNELWMRYYCRFIDAMPTFNKPGCVLMWVNCRHPYYIRGNDLPEHIKKAQARKDRPWVGDVWNLFKAGHQVEADNMKAILESRFGKLL